MTAESQKRLKSTPITFAKVLIVIGSSFVLVKLLGYMLISTYEIAWCGIFSMFIIILTHNVLKNRSEKSKIITFFTAILPLIAMLFVIINAVVFLIVNRFASETTVLLYVLHSSIVLICSLVMFFVCLNGKALRISLGIVYSLLLVLIFCIFFIMIMFRSFGANTIVRSELSPNSVFLAEIITSDQGALGGDTFVEVTRQNKDINLFIFDLKKAPKRIYTGRWGEFETMTLYWENDEVLYINEKEYVIQ